LENDHDTTVKNQKDIRVLKRLENTKPHGTPDTMHPTPRKQKTALKFQHEREERKNRN
jgi:hypothetical protein